MPWRSRIGSRCSCQSFSFVQGVIISAFLTWMTIWIGGGINSDTGAINNIILIALQYLQCGIIFNGIRHHPPTAGAGAGATTPSLPACLPANLPRILCGVADTKLPFPVYLAMSRAMNVESCCHIYSPNYIRGRWQSWRTHSSS